MRAIHLMAASGLPELSRLLLVPNRVSYRCPMSREHMCVLCVCLCVFVCVCLCLCVCVCVCWDNAGVHLSMCTLVAVFEDAPRPCLQPFHRLR